MSRSRSRVALVSLLSSLSVLLVPGVARAAERYLDPVFTSVDEIANLDYWPQSSSEPGNGFHFVDLYLPAGDTLAARPLIVLIHGGGFSSYWGYLQRRGGSLPDWARELARRGYVVASVEYRVRNFSGLQPYFPCNYDQGAGVVNACNASVFDAATEAQLDVQAAIAFLRARASTYRLDPARLATWGFSAGAITALNVVNRPDAAGGFTAARAVVAVSGAMIDSEQRAGAPPMLLLHGERDPVIDHEEAREVLRRARALGNLAELRSFCSLGHDFDVVREHALGLGLAHLYEHVIGTRPAAHLGQWYGQRSRSVLAYRGQVEDEPGRGLVGDFDGDGRDDVLFHGAGTACDTAWLAEAGGSFAPVDFAARALSIDAGQHPYVGDFDGNGADDVLVHGAGAAPDEIWWGSASGFHKQSLTITSEQPPLQGDFDGNGADDLLWFGPSATATLWYGDASAVFDVKSIEAYWWLFRPSVGDFDGNGTDDVLWYRPGPDSDVVWWGVGNRSFAGAVLPAIDGDYQTSLGDLDGDGADDVFWLGAEPRIWYGGSSRWFSESASNVYWGLFDAHPGDFGGDGVGDVFWHSRSPGADYLWFGSKQRSFTGMATPTMDGAVTPLIGDFDGDGVADWFWQAG